MSETPAALSAPGGVVIRAAGPLVRIVEGLEEARLLSAFPEVSGVTLRERLGLPAPQALELSAEVVPAFPAAKATR